MERILCIGGPRSGRRVSHTNPRFRIPLYYRDRAETFTYVLEAIQTPEELIQFYIPEGQTAAETFKMLFDALELGAQSGANAPKSSTDFGGQRPTTAE